MGEGVPNSADGVDRARFTRSLNVAAVRVEARRCQALVKALGKKHLFDRPRLRTVLQDPRGDGTRRVVLLHQRYSGASALGALPQEARSVVEASDGELLQHDVPLTYEYFTADEVLRELLPPGSEVPSSFETVGHVAHVNLRTELLPYKSVIGAVLLEKNAPRIRSVVNKVGTIENEFRVFRMEVLAGDKSLETEVKQHGCTFRMDYREVYWNSRLETEHNRLMQLFKAGETVCDLMAGIGPFAVPAARKGCRVIANDLNPHSARWLRTNARLNNVSGRLCSYNMDAREFLRTLTRPLAERDGVVMAPEPSTAALAQFDAPFVKPSGGEAFDHAVMNLPATAIEFLDAFRGCCRGAQWDGRPTPLVHCYCFAKGDETREQTLERAEKAIGGTIESPEVHVVRDVAPSKLMLCLTFRVPNSVAYAPDDGTASESPAAKRARVDGD